MDLNYLLSVSKPLSSGQHYNEARSYLLTIDSELSVVIRGPINNAEETIQRYINFYHLMACLSETVPAFENLAIYIPKKIEEANFLLDKGFIPPVGKYANRWLVSYFHQDAKHLDLGIHNFMINSFINAMICRSIIGAGSSSNHNLMIDSFNIIIPLKLDINNTWTGINDPMSRVCRIPGSISWEDYRPMVIETINHISEILKFDPISVEGKNIQNLQDMFQRYQIRQPIEVEYPRRRGRVPGMRNKIHQPVEVPQRGITLHQFNRKAPVDLIYDSSDIVNPAQFILSGLGMSLDNPNNFHREVFSSLIPLVDPIDLNIYGNSIWELCDLCITPNFILEERIDLLYQLFWIVTNLRYTYQLLAAGMTENPPTIREIRSHISWFSNARRWCLADMPIYSILLWNAIQHQSENPSITIDLSNHKLSADDDFTQSWQSYLPSDSTISFGNCLKLIHLYPGAGAVNHIHLSRQLFVTTKLYPGTGDSTIDQLIGRLLASGYQPTPDQRRNIN